MHIENLIVARVNKTFHAYYGTLKFRNKFTNAVTESYLKPQEFSLITVYFWQIYLKAFRLFKTFSRNLPRLLSE
jgi:hypothetical protein